jgi:PBS lyase HEAT-like repeat
MYVRIAAYATGYDLDEPEGVAKVIAFSKCWQGLEAEGLLRAMSMANGDDWFFAIRFLFASGFTIASEEAVLRLTSADRLTRWYSALYLGRLKDQRRIPALEEMLATPFPSLGEYFAIRLTEWRYEEAKYGAAYTLGELGEPSCAPSVRKALINTLRTEQGRPPEPPDQLDKVIWSCTVRYLQDYEHELVYGLGRLGAFGALWGVDVPEDRLATWRIHLIMGSLHGQYRLADVIFFRDAPAPLLSRVSDSLRDIFGIAPADQDSDLRAYEQSLLGHVADMYYAEELESSRTTAERVY